MLSAAEIEQKLFDLSDRFTWHMRRKEYAQAKSCYDTALDVALFVGLDPEKLLKLFGSRQEEPPAEGLFREKDVMKAMEECIKRRRKEEETVRANLMERYGTTRPEIGKKRFRQK